MKNNTRECNMKTTDRLPERTPACWPPMITKPNEIQNTKARNAETDNSNNNNNNNNLL